jgi:hypothetical protein
MTLACLNANCCGWNVCLCYGLMAGVSQVFSSVIILLLAKLSMLVTSSKAESSDDVTGTRTVQSSVNLTILFVCGCFTSMSLTINENKKGPGTVLWGTPLLILTKLVTVPSTATLCFQHDIKLMSQMIIYGLRFVDVNFCVKISWGTLSNALLKSKYIIRMKLAWSSNHFSQWCWHFMRATVVFEFSL